VTTIWVDSQSGSDGSGDGSRQSPYYSIDKALTVFASGDQIRILPGTYVTTDSIVISGLDGSIFAEDPYSVYVQPLKTTKHRACVAILESGRFTLQGINVLQAADSSGNLVGIYAENIETFLCYTCAVYDFDVPSGNGVGIFASAEKGRVERCEVSNFNCAGQTTHGIWTKGIPAIDCPVASISGVNYCWGILMDGLKDA